ncbi:MAG: sarcosine oxidase subunit gamma family protein [Planktotalea sp.]|uniref:sarcosine oxidase subunit gamma n=1 Tax=Planktotalea sp. TaxID=2029877 RepID=UPI003C752F11
MSNAVSALQSVAYTDGIAEVHELGLRGMVTLRGDFTDKKLIKALKALVGAMPEQREILHKDDRSVAWMSPDEMLLMMPHTQAASTVENLNASLNGTHFLAVNVSDARAVFEVTGEHAREVMAKLAPVDFARDAFNEGMFRRTRLAQVPAAFWMSDELSFQIVCFRSVAQYVFDLLSVAAQPGSEVGAL